MSKSLVPLLKIVNVLILEDPSSTCPKSVSSVVLGVPLKSPGIETNGVPPWTSIIPLLTPSIPSAVKLII